MDKMTTRHQSLRNGGTVVTVFGRLTLGSAGEQIEVVVDELLRKGKRAFVVDLAGVTAIDSTGIGHLIASYKKIVAAGGQLRIAGGSGHVADLFRVSKLDTVIPFYATVDAAIT